MNKHSQLLFPQAVTYPQFFNHNLLDSNRILKITQGNNCWSRAFYYQILKIIFQFQSQSQQEQPINYGYLLIKLAKQTASKISDPFNAQKIINSISMIQNFLQNQIHNSQLQFEQYINKNKQIDQAIVNILEQIIIQAGLQQVTQLEKIKYLCQMFQEHYIQFQKGIKIQESDTFFYVDNEDDMIIYIAFLDLMSQFQQEQVHQEERQIFDNVDHRQISNKSNSSNSNINNHNNSNNNNIHLDNNNNTNNNNKTSNSNSNNNTSNNSNPSNNQHKYIQQYQPQNKQIYYHNSYNNNTQNNQNVITSLNPLTIQINDKKQYKKQSPVDYLLTNKFRGNYNNVDNFQKIKMQGDGKRQNQDKNNIKLQEQYDIQKQRYKDKQKEENSLQFTLGKKIQDNSATFKIISQAQNSMTHPIIEQNTLTNYNNTIKNKQYIADNKIMPRNPIQKIPKLDKQQLFYKPTLITSKQNNKNSPTSNDSRTLKKDPLDLCNDSEKGTFYRKFTDTRILNLLAQPYRSKVKMLKTRFIGIHTRNQRTGIYNDKIF